MDDVNKLPTIKIIARAFVTVWELRNEFIKKLYLPLLYLIGAEYANNYADDKVSYILDFIGVFVYVFLAVTCHRIIILGIDSVPEFGVRKWTMIETRFLLFLIGVYLVIGLTIFSFSMTPMLVGFLGDIFVALSIPIDLNFINYATFISYVAFFSMIPVVYSLFRISLIFPAIAVGEKASLKWAWNISRNNGWRLAIIVGALPIAVEIFQYVFLSNEEIERISKNMIIIMVTYIVAIIEITALSLSYKKLKNEI